MTKSNKSLFGKPGTFYIYKSYGIHHCLNIVTDKENFASGVLLRSVFISNKKDIKCMTKITKEEVKKVSHLARLELNENEINNHAQQLEKILDYIKQLEKIDTEEVPCTTRAIEVVNVFRKDEKKNSDCNEELLEMAPSKEDKYFKVPKIIDE